MPRKNLADHIDAVLGEEYLEASRIRDRLHERMKGGTPSIRELTSHLGRNKNVISINAPAGKTQIKKYAKKKIVANFEKG